MGWFNVNCEKKLSYYQVQDTWSMMRAVASLDCEAKCKSYRELHDKIFFRRRKPPDFLEINNLIAKFGLSSFGLKLERLVKSLNAKN